MAAEGKGLDSVYVLTWINELELLPDLLSGMGVVTAK